MLSSLRPYTLAESVALTIRQSRAEIRRSRELLASTAHLVPRYQDPASATADSSEPATVITPAHANCTSASC